MLKEEETGVDTERISVDAFRRRFCAPAEASTGRKEDSAAKVGRSQKVTPSAPPRFRRVVSSSSSSSSGQQLQPPDDLKSRQKKSKEAPKGEGGGGGSTSSSSGSFVLQKVLFLGVFSPSCDF